MVNLNRFLGNDDEAKRIEQVGCSWWWGMEYEQVISGKLSGLKETRYECGRVHVGAMIKDQGARVEEACQSMQTFRNEIARGFQMLAEQSGVTSLLSVLPATPEDLLVTENQASLSPHNSQTEDKQSPAD